MLGSLSVEAIAVAVSVSTSQPPAWLQTPTPGLSVLEDGLGQSSEENEAPCLSRCGSFGFTQQSCSENHATTVSHRVAGWQIRKAGRLFACWRATACTGASSAPCRSACDSVAEVPSPRSQSFSFLYEGHVGLHLSVCPSVSRSHPCCLTEAPVSLSVLECLQKASILEHSFPGLNPTSTSSAPSTGGGFSSMSW